MHDSEAWVACPVCGRKTRYRVRADTVAIRLPIWCHICKHETVVGIAQGKVNVLKTPPRQEV